MTNTNFRKQAIATLKGLRESGTELQVKLNASNQALYNELQRIEAELFQRETEIYNGLEDIYQQAKAAGLTATATAIETASNPSVPDITEGPSKPIAVTSKPIVIAAKATAKAIHIARHTDYRKLLDQLLFPFILCYVLGTQVRFYLAASSRLIELYGNPLHSVVFDGTCVALSKATYRNLRVRKANNTFRILLLEKVLCLN